MLRFFNSWPTTHIGAFLGGGWMWTADIKQGNAWLLENDRLFCSKGIKAYNSSTYLIRTRDRYLVSCATFPLAEDK